MTYIILMTSGGSILFVEYLLWRKLMGRHMSQAAGYWGLVIVMFTYLVPWVWVRDLYKSIGALFRRNAAAGGRLVMGSETVRGADKFSMTPDVNTMLAITVLWGCIAVLVVLVRSIFYFKRRRKLLGSARLCVSLYAAQGVEGVPEELVSRIKRELRIRRRVEVLRIPGINASLTLGTFRPVVFLQADCRDEELELVLRHEFTHIARGDLIVKALMGLVKCLHWFNPLVYLLSAMQESACEKACDERVVKGRPDGERKIYAELLRRSMASAPKKKTPTGSYLAFGRNYGVERIRVVMDKRQRKAWEKLLVAGAFAVMLFVDSLTALAYPDLYNINVSEPADLHTQSTGIVVVYNTKENAGGEDSSVVYPVLYDREVITAGGEIYPVNDQTGASCSHQWEKAHYGEHTRDDKGSCIVRVSECTYCSECGSINVGDLISDHTYAACPHDY